MAKNYVTPTIKVKRLESAENILAASDGFEEGETMDIGNGGGSSNPVTHSKPNAFSGSNSNIWSDE